MRQCSHFVALIFSDIFSVMYKKCLHGQVIHQRTNCRYSGENFQAVSKRVLEFLPCLSFLQHISKGHCKRVLKCEDSLKLKSCPSYFLTIMIFGVVARGQLWPRWLSDLYSDRRPWLIKCCTCYDVAVVVHYYILALSCELCYCWNPTWSCH